MEVVHIRVLKQAGTRGVLASPRHSKFFLTLPGQDEQEVPALRAVRLTSSFDDADQVELTMYGTIEVQYEEGATNGAT